MRKIIVMCLIGMAVAACTSIDCPVNNNVRAYYALMKADGKPDTLKTDTMWVWTPRVDGTDTVISRQIQGNLVLNCFFGSTASSFDLPISYTQPEDVLIMYMRNAKGENQDTVSIKKENIPHFESVDCNASFFHTLTDVRYTKNYIDSLVIKNPSVTYDSETVHFYLYPKSGD